MKSSEFEEVEKQKCAAKEIFDGFMESRQRAAKVWRQHGILLRSYECPWCNKWHLTSKNLEK